MLSLAKVLGGVSSIAVWDGDALDMMGQKCVLLSKSGPEMESRLRKKPLSGICKSAFLECLNVYCRLYDVSSDFSISWITIVAFSTVQKKEISCTSEVVAHFPSKYGVVFFGKYKNRYEGEKRVFIFVQSLKIPNEYASMQWKFNQWDYVLFYWTAVIWRTNPLKNTHLKGRNGSLSMPLPWVSKK